MLYAIVKWIHILSAIAAFGATITYFPWFLRVEKNRETLKFTLSVIQFLDNWIANPAYTLALVTGEIIIFISGIPQFKTSWLVLSLILYAAATVVGLFFFAPQLKKQRQLAETVGAEHLEYQRAAGKTITIGMVNAALTLAITFLMTVKPQIW